MFKERLVSVAVGGLLMVGLSAACSDDSDDDANRGREGTAGKPSTSGPPSSSSAGKGGSAPAVAGAANHEGGAAGARDAFSPVGAAGGTGSDGAGAGGEGGAPLSCPASRETLLGPVDAVTAGTVEDLSATTETVVTLQVDASAGGHMAAATNPYIYVQLAGKSRVNVTDLAADSSLDWDIALKRDNLRSNSGDSGPGAAEVAVLEGVDFEAVTRAALGTADFAADTFVDPVTCAPIADVLGKPSTRFDGWYAYDGATMKLSPADRVYLIRDAGGAAVYKLQITGYYVDVPNGTAGTNPKSAVYTLRYAAL